ncbi:MAG: cell division protein ZapB [Desulfobulbaceae bacterium]
MSNNEELVRLEQFVDNLLTKYRKLQETYRALEASMEERDTECARLKETIAELRSERSEVGNRVAGLLERIERWEVEQVDGETGGEAKVEPEGLQGNLFKKERVAVR